LTLNTRQGKDTSLIQRRTPSHCRNGKTHIITLICDQMSRMELCYTFSVTKCTDNKLRACSFIVPIPVLLSHLRAIQGHSTCRWHRGAETGKDVLRVQGKRALSSQIISRGSKSDEIISEQGSQQKLQPSVGYQSLLKLHSSQLPVTRILCKIERMLIPWKTTTTTTTTTPYIIQPTPNNSNNPNNSSNNVGPSFPLASYLTFLRLETRSQSKATLSVINTGRGLSADVNKEALVDVVSGTEYAHPAKPVQITACAPIATLRSRGYWGACSSRPSWRTQAPTVFSGQSVPLKTSHFNMHSFAICSRL